MLTFHYNASTTAGTIGLVVVKVNNVPMPRYDAGDPRALQRPLINDPATGKGTLGQRFRNYSGDGTGGGRKVNYATVCCWGVGKPCKLAWKPEQGPG